MHHDDPGNPLPTASETGTSQAGPRGDLPYGSVKRVVLVAPRGFCAGVVRAVDTVEAALKRFGPPVYVRRAIVHNPHVVGRLAEAGAIFVQELEEVPAGSIVIFSAHGVARAVHESAASLGLRAIDATCPLVTKVHNEVVRFLSDDYDVVLIGHAGHDEVIGTMGQWPGRVQLVQSVDEVDRVVARDPERLACLTQTTLSPDEVDPIIEALRGRFPRLARPRVEDICFATHNRQEAVRWLSGQVDAVLVLGDQTSSNSHRLREVAASNGKHAFLLGSISEADPAWFHGCEAVGITAGASTPEWIVQEAVDYFLHRGARLEESSVRPEAVQFRPPAELADEN